MLPRRYTLAIVRESEDGWQERVCRLEEQYRQAAGRAGGDPNNTCGWVLTAFPGEPRSVIYFSTINPQLRDAFVALGAQPETETG